MASAVTYYVLIVIELSTRRVYLGGVTPHPDHAFMMQVARNLTDCCDGFLREKRFLILDRDKKYSEGFRNLLEDAGTDIVRLPVRSPNLNATIELQLRFVVGICFPIFWTVELSPFRKSQSGSPLIWTTNS